MLLGELISELDGVSVVGSLEVEIKRVTESSEHADKETVFVCIKGEKRDGRQYAKDAVARGASVLVSEGKLPFESVCTIIYSNNARKTMAEIAAILNGHPERTMTLIGITGTKGKTTTAAFLAAALSATGARVMTVGTLGIIGLKKRRYPKSGNTTPSSVLIYDALAAGRAEGMQYAIIEVSSQALVHYRVYGLPFRLVISTSFSYDHIGKGEHKNFEEYFLAKRRLFTDFGAEAAVVNADDKSCVRMAEGVPRITSCGTDENCEYHISRIYSLPSGAAFRLKNDDFRLSMHGEYNVKNACLAIAAAEQLTGHEPGFFKQAISQLRVRGRFELYELSGVNIVIDFAHNAESIKELCRAVRRISVGRVILLFGSVGGRAEGRRRALARAAEENSDLAIITSDNPADENPVSICNDIRRYFTDTSRCKIIVDREEAIRFAVSCAHRGDYILLAGKGHEEYQLIGESRIPFSEKSIIKSLGGHRCS